MDWHQRFQQQAVWTESVRKYLAGRANLQKASRILETGCGTGAITRSLHSLMPAGIYGLDFNRSHLETARQHDPSTRFCAADARHMPFPSGVFDAVVCHFFLMWVPDPAGAMREMVRVARPGGTVIAFAEPDYGGRIDYPPPLDTLGTRQAEALRSQGADPRMGRKLSGLFHAASLQQVETGLLGGEWRGAPSPEQRESEWAVLADDLAGQILPQELRELREIEDRALQSGERVLFVPTFFALGRKPG